jgi:phenylacetate-CoA ligase
MAQALWVSCRMEMNKEEHTNVTGAKMALQRPTSSMPVFLQQGSGEYETDRQRHLRLYKERLPGEVEKLRWPLKQLHTRRDEQLRALVRTAKERSPWHARRLSRIDPESLSGDDLSALPTMTKVDLMTHWDEIVTDRRITLNLASQHLWHVAEQGPAYLLNQYHVTTSGGTSGLRGVYLWDFEGWLQAALTQGRYMEWRAGYLKVPTPLRTAHIKSPSPIHASGALYRTFLNSQEETRSFPVTLKLADMVAALNAYQPHVLRSYPSILRQLTLEARAGRLQIAPGLLQGGGEPLTLELRRMAETTFGVPLLDIYTSSETYWMAVSSPGSPDLHLIEDTIIYEPVDSGGQPVPPGVPAAKVLITNVMNQAMPLIRYELTDQVTFLNGPSSDPWTGRRIAPVQGRLEDMFVYAGGIEVNPFIFNVVMDEQPAIDEYQIRQTEGGVTISVRTSGTADLEHAQQKLVAFLQQQGLTNPDVSISVVERFERQTGSGKFKRFIALPQGG